MTTMVDTLPDDVIAYRRTPIFDQDSVPAGLKRRHVTKDAVWGLIVVLEGQLLLRNLEPMSGHLLTPQMPGVVLPQRPHEVETVGPVSFFVEFYSKAENSAEMPATPKEGSAYRAPSAATPPVAQEELIASLNELLEAERAGARVARETAGIVKSPAVTELLQHIQHDEARWCAMLLRRIRSAGGTASPRMGAFYEKAMTIDDPTARIAFLNRGQGWVVRKLRALLPKVHDAALLADLSHMLSSHVANITLANSVGTGTPPGDAR